MNLKVLRCCYEIGSHAFSFNQLESVNIPHSLSSIGDSAFKNKLTSIEIPESVTSIGSNFGYNQLTSVDIPNSVTAIGEVSKHQLNM